MRDIVIWGTGAVARKLYYTIMQEKEITVKYFVDNAPVSSFYGHEVYRPSKEKCSRYLVVVASDAHYDAISAQLTEYGRKELRDYIPYEALGKEVVLVHGNCHVHVIKEYLKTSKTFNDKFYLYPLPLIQDNKKRYIKDDLLENCDVFIYQDIQKDNQFDERLSADYLSVKVKKKKICIPNVFGMGTFLFPQAAPIKNDDMWSDHIGEGMAMGFFNYRDENIDCLWRDGKRDINEMAEYLEGDIYDEKYVKKNLEISFEKMEKREQFWDIKIIDYIRREYRNEQMFYDPAHPCNNVLRKISEKLLEKLDIDKAEIREVGVHVGYHEMPIYKCVKEALNLKYEKKYIRDVAVWELSKIVPKDMDLKEYCKEYCYWCCDWYLGMV